MDVVISGARLFDLFGGIYEAVCGIELQSRNDMRSSIVQRLRRGYEVRTAISDSELRHKVLVKLGVNEKAVPEISLKEMTGNKYRFFVAHIDDHGYIRFYRVHVHSIKYLQKRSSSPAK